jgi:protein ImuB
MRLWIALSLPRLPLDALHPPWPLEGTACAVLDHDRVVTLTPAAAALGITPGMRRGGVGAIAPDVLLLERDRKAEQDTLQDCALALLQYTPQVALGADDALLLDVGASLRLFHGPRALARRVAASLRALGVQARLGMAPTAMGAWLLAHRPARGPRRILREDRLARYLDALPCALLPPARDQQDWLHDIGCRTLGDLRRLPRAGLGRRCGPLLLDAVDAAYPPPAVALPREGDAQRQVDPHPAARPPGGGAQRQVGCYDVYEWITPPLRFRRRYELMENLEHTDGVYAVACKLVEQMSGWLTARQRAVSRLALSLEHERGRHARPPSVLELALAEPAWQPSHLLGLLRERLDRMTLQAPVIALILDAPETAPHAAPNATLFPEPAHAAEDRARLVDLLTARLGRGRVLRPCAEADHRPEVANRWTAAHDSTPAPVLPPAPLDRPIWLIEPPVPLRMHRNRPLYGTPLRLLRGPERIESGWWDAQPAIRDYFVAEDEQAARYWIYRERDQEAAHWYLQGLFG